jgi:hypothetical protein
MTFKTAKKEARESLQKWVNGRGYIARQETAYLRYDRDLIELGPFGDEITTTLESWVERILIRTFKSFRRVCNPFVLTTKS